MEQVVAFLKEYELLKVIIVAILLAVSVFIINFFIRKFFQRTDFIEERKEKQLKV